MAMAARKPRRGRPPVAPERKRSVRVSVMVTPGEYEALERLAADQGLTLSTALHEIVVRSLRRRRTR